MSCPSCHHRIWREDGKCRPCSLAMGHADPESMHLLAVRTRILVTEKDLLRPRPTFYVHDSIITEVPLEGGAQREVFTPAVLAEAMSQFMDPIPGVDVEWINPQGVLCPSCERTNCLVGQAEKQRVARFRRMARMVTFGYPSSGSGKSNMAFAAMRNLPPDATVVRFDTEADMGVHWHDDSYSMVTTPADHNALLHGASQVIEYPRVTNGLAEAVNALPRRAAVPHKSRRTKGLAAAVNALPRMGK